MLPDEISADDWFRRKIANAVEGYADLELWDCAWEELERLNEAERDLPEMQEVKLALLMRQKRWPEAIQVGRELCRIEPDLPMPFIHTAFCLHELGETWEALQMLRRGPNCLQQDALFHYNSACYLAVLGFDDEAREQLRTAFALDDSLQENARTDPDLKNLRPAED
jgi:tetratricopeptide (TPR) repeat protein